MPEFRLESSTTRLSTIATVFLDAVLFDGALAIDGTVGNGYDTLYLAHRVGPRGHVLGFDVQKGALTGAGELLRFTGVFNRVRLVLDDHAHIGRYLALEQNVQAAMFNLGFLPRSNRQVITHPETTVKALDEVLIRLARSGRATVLSYRGHAGGPEEHRALVGYLRALTNSFEVREFTGARDAADTPRLFTIERCGDR